MQFFVKIFRSLMTSWIADDPTLDHVTRSLLSLCDEEGCLNMDYPAISKWTGWPVEVLIEKMDILQQPQPRSRDQTCEGRTIVRIDPERPWGWRFVNFKKYRELRDPRERKDYKRRWDRKHRKRPTKSDTSDSGPTIATTGAQRGKSQTPSEPIRHDPTINHDSRSKPSDSFRQLPTVSDEIRPNQKKSTEVPPAVPQGGPQPAEDADKILPRNAIEKYRLQLRKEKKREADYVLDWEEAKSLICRRILGGKNPSRPWSCQAMHDLARQMPIPRLEIERIAWFRSLPNDGTPELEARKTITEAGLMAFWGDEFTRANNFWRELFGWREKLRKEKEKEAAE